MRWHFNEISVSRAGALAIGLGILSTATWTAGGQSDESVISGLNAAGVRPAPPTVPLEAAPRGGPVNDDCSDVTPVTLEIGDTVTFQGDNTGATMDCAALGFPEVWHAVTLDTGGIGADVTTDHCGTAPEWGIVFVVIDTACPCSGQFIFASSFDQATCGDGNWAIHYLSLPDGTYYTPVILDPASGSEGAYTWNISAVEAKGAICGPGSGTCCVPHDTPGCDMVSCCELICSIDPYCCETAWDFTCVYEGCDLCVDLPDGHCDCYYQLPCDSIPQNDICDNAYVIHDGDLLSDCTSSADSDGSSSCGFSEDSPDVWYLFTSSCPLGGWAHAETCDSVYDTVLSVHTHCVGDTANEIACNDDYCSPQAAVDWNTSGGTTYVIRVSGGSADTGFFRLTVAETCNEPPPICPSPAQCDGDVNGDGIVDPLDSGAVLSRFGLDPCGEADCRADVNCDGAIDPLDVGYVVARFGTCTPPVECVQDFCD